MWLPPNATATYSVQKTVNGITTMNQSIRVTSNADGRIRLHCRDGTRETTSRSARHAEWMRQAERSFRRGVDAVQGEPDDDDDNKLYPTSDDEMVDAFETTTCAVEKNGVHPPCDFQNDVITQSIIPRDRGVCLNQNCQNIDALARDMYRQDPFTRQKLDETLKSNLMDHARRTQVYIFHREGCGRCKASIELARRARLPFRKYQIDKKPNKALFENKWTRRTQPAPPRGDMLPLIFVGDAYIGSLEQFQVHCDRLMRGD